MNLETTKTQLNNHLLLSNVGLTNNAETESMFQTINTEPKLENREEVFDRLQKMIRQGIFLPGEQLPAERDLAKQLGVSRPTLREGIGILVAAGVIQTKQGIGNFVAVKDKATGFDPKILSLQVWFNGFSSEELIEIQTTIAIQIVEFATKLATNEHSMELSEEIIEMYSSLTMAKEFLVHERRFHQIIAKASGNRIMATLTDALFIFLSDRTGKELKEKELKEITKFHHQIYRCIRNGNSETAKQTMRNYLLYRLKSNFDIYENELIVA